MRLDRIIVVMFGMAAVVSGCQPASPGLPVTGAITLNVVPSAGPDRYFQLRNQSSRVIAFRGSRVEDNRAYPWDGWMECMELVSGAWTPGPYALVDGGDATIEVGSGQQLEMMFGFGNHQQFADDYKGGRCRFQLKLLDGSTVTSDEFPATPDQA